MKNLVLPIFAVLCVLICGCSNDDPPKLMGSGVSKTETRSVPEFERIVFYGMGTMEIAAGPATPLTITGDDNIVPIMDTSVAGGRLSIRPTEDNINPKVPLVIQASSPMIREVESAGSAEIILKDIAGEELRLAVNGAGRVKATGKVISLIVNMKGAGEIDTTSVEAERVSVTITGAGSAEVAASSNLDVTITGAGTLRYVGDPQVSKKILGIGSVEKK